MAGHTTTLIFLVLCGIFQAMVAGCPDGWLSHGQSCYVLLHEQYSWFDAKIACEVLDARLVEIQSKAENDYVAGLIRSHGATQSWLGLEDILEEGSFVWLSTKEAPEQTFWGTNEPDDRYGGEDCAAMTSTGLWFDGLCERTQRNFICEMDSQESPVIG